MVAELYRRLETAGVGPRIREMAHKLLSQAMQQALRWGEIGQNIMAAID